MNWLRESDRYEDWWLELPNSITAYVNEDSTGDISASCSYGEWHRASGSCFTSADAAKTWVVSELRKRLEAERARLDGLLKELDGVS